MFNESKVKFSDIVNGFTKLKLNLEMIEVLFDFKPNKRDIDLNTNEINTICTNLTIIADCIKRLKSSVT